MIFTAQILAIGDELVRGSSIDTNSAWLAQRLGLIGYEIQRFQVLGDDVNQLAPVIRRACADADVVLMTGGLGPTLDDVSRDAAAAAAGVTSCFDAAAWQGIVDRFARIGRPLPESNRRQAFLPTGADLLSNDWGTAPGFAMRIDRATLFALPGVPAEMKAMFEARVLPRLPSGAGTGEALCQRAFQVLGCSEAELGERIAGFMARDAEPRVGITVTHGLMTVRVAGHDQVGVDATAEAIRPLLGRFLVSEGEESLVSQLVRRLQRDGITLALAESCTGGMLAAAITDIPGVSTTLLAGFVSYSNASKERDLGVPAAILQQYGAVSREVGAEMARGAAQRSGARLAIAISGVAGPTGGTADKPIGTVCFAIWFDRAVHSFERRFANVSRTFVRHRSMLEAAHLALCVVEGRPTDPSNLASRRTDR